MKRTITFGILVILAAAGCQPQATSSTGTTAAAPAAAPAPAPISTPATRIGGLELNPLETRSSTPAAAPAASPAQTQNQNNPATTPAPAAAAPAATPAPAPGNVQVKAEAGAGIKGQSLNQHSGVLVEPAKAYFRVGQRLAYDSVTHALNLFKASEGRLPNSHEEFMTKIVAANNIQLPPLPQGHKYVYSVDKGELMVEKPAK